MKTQERKPVSVHGSIVEELIDLRGGAWSRLGSTAWALRQSVEKITNEAGKDADMHLKAAKRHIVDVERCLAAYRDYAAQLEKLVGP